MLFILASCLVAAGIIISRVHIFYESYSEFTLQRVEEEWLRKNCQDPDFYSNMRQHTDLCALVNFPKPSQYVTLELNQL